MEKKAQAKGLLIFGIAVLGIFLAVKYLIPLLLPFIIALLIAAVLRYPIKILEKRTKLSPRLLSAILVSAVIFLLGFLIFLAVNRLITELEGFFISLGENSDKYISNFFGFIDRLAEKIPFINATGADLSQTVSEAVQNMLTQATSRLPSIVAGIITMLPQILLFAVILILASYYFCADFDAVKQRLFSLLPEKAQKGIKDFKARLAKTGIKYLKSCLIILLITYFELLAGFLMLGIPYSFTLSLLVAAVDMLPIFGVGTVLVPWAIWCQLSGDTYTAIGLVIIFTVVTVIRRFIEPKIISSGIGLTPLTTLLAMYIGFRLFGLTGLILSPLAAVLIIHALPDGVAARLGINREDEEKGDKQ